MKATDSQLTTDSLGREIKQSRIYRDSCQSMQEPGRVLTK
ncbi:hypothetical protein L665_00184 [Ralstonia solanacearum SD54]|nr:hypothetical protein F504_3793 [Ralstonia pseudosolanacearum FQY_4]ANH36425.1 hypothetical protein A3768_5648 [Ralstonia solanacearum]ESS51920.1 hypothetical protein L665_00184 [Ralstonia solanacearum SD54]